MRVMAVLAIRSKAKNLAMAKGNSRDTMGKKPEKRGWRSDFLMSAKPISVFLLVGSDVDDDDLVLLGFFGSFSFRFCF